MKVPDNYAAFVNRDTDAVIQMNSLPGVEIHAKVTRFSPSLLNPENDRTMRVEVDLYNGTIEQYKRFLAREQASGNADLKSHKLPALHKSKARSLALKHWACYRGSTGKCVWFCVPFTDPIYFPAMRF